MSFKKRIAQAGTTLALLGAVTVSANSVEASNWTARTVDEVRQDVENLADGQAYTIKYGDTLNVISEAVGVPTSKLAQVYNIEDINVIEVGQKVHVNGEKTVVSVENEQNEVVSYDVSEEEVQQTETTEEAAETVEQSEPVQGAVEQEQSAPVAPVSFTEELTNEIAESEQAEETEEVEETEEQQVTTSTSEASEEVETEEIEVEEPQAFQAPVEETTEEVEESTEEVQVEETPEVEETEESTQQVEEPVQETPAPAREVEEPVQEETTPEVEEEPAQPVSQPEPEPAPAPQTSATNVLEAGSHAMGTPYAWGGSTLAGFDCSGFVQWAFAQTGQSVPRTTGAQMAASIPVSNPIPGDLVFFGNGGAPTHVGIYAGNGQFLGSQTSTGVAYASVHSGYWGARFMGYGRI